MIVMFVAMVMSQRKSAKDKVAKLKGKTGPPDRKEKSTKKS
jgi:hypothetical protein